MGLSSHAAPGRPDSKVNFFIMFDLQNGTVSLWCLHEFSWASSQLIYGIGSTQFRAPQLQIWPNSRNSFSPVSSLLQLCPIFQHLVDLESGLFSFGLLHKTCSFMSQEHYIKNTDQNELHKSSYKFNPETVSKRPILLENKTLTKIDQLTQKPPNLIQLST